MWFRSVVIREGQPSAWSPPEPRSQAAEHGLVRVVVAALAASLTSQHGPRPRSVLFLRGVMAILVSAKNTQTTALRVRTGLTEHTCKGLGPVEAPTPRYTHDCARIFFLFWLCSLPARLLCTKTPLSSRGAPPAALLASVEPLVALGPAPRVEAPPTAPPC